jgi:type II secretory pathway pseudopilin PulG
MRLTAHRRQPGFSLIEVAFAIAALVAVGVAMSVLSTNALRLVDKTELEVTAQSLNEEALTVVANLRQADPQFLTTITTTGCTTTGCWLDCPVNPLNQPCTLASSQKSVVLGVDKLQFTRQVKITQIVGPPVAFVINVTTKWGQGTNRQANASLRID